MAGMAAAKERAAAATVEVAMAMAAEATARVAMARVAAAMALAVVARVVATTEAEAADWGCPAGWPAGRMEAALSEEAARVTGVAGRELARAVASTDVPRGREAGALAAVMEVLETVVCPAALARARLPPWASRAEDSGVARRGTEGAVEEAAGAASTAASWEVALEAAPAVAVAAMQAVRVVARAVETVGRSDSRLQRSARTCPRQGRSTAASQLLRR